MSVAERKVEPQDEEADFERAIETSGFGLFNILLLLVSTLPRTAFTFEMTTMSYVMSSAECDLELSLLNKGTLNAMIYAGIISSAFLWGYLADTKGRKKLLVWGLLIDGCCVLGGALSQSYEQLMVFKFLGGFVISGPFTVLYSYIAELHGKQYRARIMLLNGFMFTAASLLLPVMAVAILPQNWNFYFIGLTVHSWQIFLAVSALPSFLGGLLFIVFPESPKFLMSQGRNKEALQVFQTIFAMNKHQPNCAYPIKALTEEMPIKPTDAELQANENIFSRNMRQLRPLFTKPYLLLSLQVYVMSICTLLGQNTLRLWLPQIFAAIEEFKQKSLGNPSMCAILEYTVNKTVAMETEGVSECEVIITVDSYFNNIIVGIAGLCGYLIAAVVVNIIGGKRILNITLALAGTTSISLYWSSSALSTLIISTIFLNMGSISTNQIMNEAANLFPTSMRTMILSLTNTFGRIGSLFGNILFPTMMTFGCLPPFLLISLLMFCACFLSLFLPNPNKGALK